VSSPAEPGPGPASGAGRGPASGAGPSPASGAGPSPASGAGRGDAPQNIATAIAEVSERAVELVHEEVELAKTEFAEKAAELARGAAIAAAAGVFVVMAVILALVGFAWLLYYYLPGPTYAFFWGFFAMAAILLVIAAGAGMLAAKIVKRGAPPVPTMAIDEAKKIRDSVSGAADDPFTGAANGKAATGPVTAAPSGPTGPGGPAGPAGPAAEAGPAGPAGGQNS